MQSANKSAPPLMKIVRGTLFPINRDSAGESFSLHQLYMAFTENGLRDIVQFDSEWDDKCITFNSIRPVEDSSTAASDFLNNLNAVMHTDVAQKMELSGGINVIIDTRDLPIILRVSVANSVVSFHKAIYEWENPVTLPRKQ